MDTHSPSGKFTVSNHQPVSFTSIVDAPMLSKLSLMFVSLVENLFFPAQLSKLTLSHLCAFMLLIKYKRDRSRD